MIPKEIKRLYFIIKIIISYSLYELIPCAQVNFFFKLFRKIIFWIPSINKNQNLGLRLKEALEQLGPIWIKFGQMLSTRNDLLSSLFIKQLVMLQNHVQPFDGNDAKIQIENSLGVSIDKYFDDFDIIPLASASISQVHTAKLKYNSKEVVIKVIRPNILQIIQSDIKLIYCFAKWISILIPEIKKLKPIKIVSDYEKLLINELNLLREASNTIQLRRNFYNSKVLYIPKVYIEYCSESILVMERIYGIPISNINKLRKHNVNIPLLAERGVKIFFTQVFRDNFFHADMHPGNIFVSYKNPSYPQYIGIDCGIIGTLSKVDKNYLAENFIAFFNRDYHKVAELHIRSGWVPLDTNINDFEFAIRTLCEPIFKKNLSEISFGNLLLNLFKIARNFNMEIQPQLILFQKTLLYIEGLGRQLYPQLDLWKTAKPFLENWIKNQFSVSSMLRTAKNNIPFLINNLPELLQDNFHQNIILRKNITQLTNYFKIQCNKYNKICYLFIIILFLFSIILYFKI